MPAAVIPISEAERLRVLRSYEVLDTASEAAFDELTRLAAQITGSPIALVSLLDADRQWFKAQVGMEVGQTGRDLAFCAHAILRPQEMLVVPDAQLDPRFLDNPLVTGAPHIRFYAGAPLVSPEGHALGTLCVIDRAPRDITPAQREALGTLARAVMTALELRRRIQAIHDLAMTDALTGLASRAAFLDALDKAIARMCRDRQPLTLLYADLDGFKAINDRHGHQAGDAVLRGVASILNEEVRREDVVGRLGGDEFAVLLAASDAEEAQRIGERLCAAIRDGLGACGWPVTASIGSTVFLSPPETVSDAIRVADNRMYEAKRAGKDRVILGTYLSGP
ncbi:GGDEF domain-containing protein [Plastoroseomonas hellenica]|uniref:GGDEF domain-containing protein n=1 Tax=Plastoroseomonas hellenica TaxID=2687306 RepID=UPI001FE6FB58|nr:sensor domain-containing diguanylate cyclase [Plastoroseomonas hellenica]